MKQIALARDADVLVCRKCGTRFPEASGTRDGWYYECPADGCDAAGIGDGLRRAGERGLGE
jgi:hypothetical protein